MKNLNTYRQDKTAWELGTCIAEIKARDERAIAKFDNLVFTEDGNGGLQTRYERLNYSSNVG
jgi:hypothetical protein